MMRCGLYAGDNASRAQAAAIMTRFVRNAK